MQSAGTDDIPKWSRYKRVPVFQQKEGLTKVKEKWEVQEHDVVMPEDPNPAPHRERSNAIISLAVNLKHARLISSHA
ncbi:hypothetical protein AXG93_1502s1080 [Marchantia polymorpha subsp. ruderalis]|uniref:Uncharacterized protein n=1 Tax=Marchantia polymorpha subsp. ruderalis TaxID=1480154 RepID=A0A176WCQ8_MARPO|nr:hypothetical protein AXG93_1502s1080 [Marchantia polymorpha subsp. ruderalis]